MINNINLKKLELFIHNMYNRNYLFQSIIINDYFNNIKYATIELFSKEVIRFIYVKNINSKYTVEYYYSISAFIRSLKIDIFKGNKLYD